VTGQPDGHRATGRTGYQRNLISQPKAHGLPRVSQPKQGTSLPLLTLLLLVITTLPATLLLVVTALATTLLLLVIATLAALATLLLVVTTLPATLLLVALATLLLVALATLAGLAAAEAGLLLGVVLALLVAVEAGLLLGVQVLLVPAVLQLLRVNPNLVQQPGVLLRVDLIHPLQLLRGLLVVPAELTDQVQNLTDIEPHEHSFSRGPTQVCASQDIGVPLPRWATPWAGRCHRPVPQRPFRSTAALRPLLEVVVLLIVAAVLAVLWLLGVVAFHITAFAIHLLLVIAVVVVIAHFVTRGRSRA